MRRVLNAAYGLLLLGCDGANCPPDAAESCVDTRDCEEVYRDYYDQHRDLYYGCGITVYMPEEPTQIPVPCDDAVKAQILCSEDCEYGVACGALNGADPAASAAYQICQASCS